MIRKLFPTAPRSTHPHISEETAQKLHERLAACDLCPLQCGVNRLGGQTGRCGAGSLARVASWTLHRGEEPPVSGRAGSGTIFFSHCPLRCRFCQNYPISQMGHGRDMDTDELSGHMLELQSRGAHNINLVTATHFIPQWYAALVRARQRGLVIPLVYNTSGYERVEVLRQIHGAVDVYLPDVKYADNEAARYCSDAPRYVEVDRAAVREMLRQTGRLRTDRRGIARRGTIVRHMVLPSGLSGTREVLQFVAGLRPRVHVSLMGQYFPAHRARDVPGLDRRLTEEEYTQALDLLDELGLKQGWVQGFREQGGC